MSYKGPMGPEAYALCNSKTDEINETIKVLKNHEGYRDSDGNVWHGVEYFTILQVERLLGEYRELLEKKLGDIIPQASGHAGNPPPYTFMK